MKPTQAFAVALVSCVIVVAGCDGSSPPRADGAMDAAVDADGTDVGAADAFDAGTDARDVADGTNPDADAAVMPANPCAVAHQGTSGLVLQGTVLAPTGPLMGEVMIDATGRIACVAANCSATAGYGNATVVSCTGSVISPGLINGHDHTEYSTVGPLAHGMTRWVHRNGWRTGAGGEPALSGLPASTTSASIVAAQELRMLLGGGTSVIGSGGVSGGIRNLAAYPDATQLEGLSGPAAYFDTFPLGDSNGTELTSGCAYPSPRAPASAFAGGAAYVPHVAEGINLAAENELTCFSGSFGLLTAQTAILQGVGLNARDVGAIASAHAKLIWSPRSNIGLYGNTAPVTELRTLGVTVALGTDWLASGSMNMLRELACADSLNQQYFAHAYTDQELWQMATTNAAVAARFDSQIGQLAPGFFADVTVFSGATPDYRAVIAASVEDVRLVLRGGRALYGDANVMAVLGTGCSDLQVCGIDKQVCLDVPGVTLADVQAAATSTYPLFFCRGITPTNEPSCVPYRSTYPTGITSADRDGDGVLDPTDDCPGAFNPVRPMDGAAQADVNMNGAGDVCDPTPLH